MLSCPFHCPGLSEPVFKGSLRLEDMEWREEYADTNSVQFQRLKRSVESEVSIQNIKGFTLCLPVKLSLFLSQFLSLAVPSPSVSISGWLSPQNVRKIHVPVEVVLTSKSKQA